MLSDKPSKPELVDYIISRRPGLKNKRLEELNIEVLVFIRIRIDIEEYYKNVKK